MTASHVIAIDGPAASGKGTLARRLAETLGFAYLDTGALYRAVGLAVLQSGGDPDDETDAVKAAQSLSQTLKHPDLQNADLRHDTVASAASKVARHPAVRDALLQFQKDFAANPPAGFKGAVLDGRDIGTVICPNAGVKFFITASVEERARRRFNELIGKNVVVNFDDVLVDMKERDARDLGRDTAPLRPAPDAHILDTSLTNADEVFKQALLLASKF